MVFKKIVININLKSLLCFMINKQITFVLLNLMETEYNSKWYYNLIVFLILFYDFVIVLFFIILLIIEL